MSMSMYIEFKRSLKPIELSLWANVHYTSFDLERATKLFNTWSDCHFVRGIWVTSLYDQLSYEMQRRILRNALKSKLSPNADPESLDIMLNLVYYRTNIGDSKHYTRYWAGELFIDVSGIVRDQCEHGPYQFLYDCFSHDGEWKTAVLGSHRFRKYLYENFPHDVDEDGREYVASGGMMNEEESLIFCWNFYSSLNLGGIFPIQLVDHIHWG